MRSNKPTATTTTTTITITTEPETHEAAEDNDHLITPEERLRIAMARQ